MNKRNILALALKRAMRVTKSPFGGAIILMMLAVLCLGLLPRVQAVVPPPDGGYPGGNTAEGQNALLTLSTGTFNTAVRQLVGFRSGP